MHFRLNHYRRIIIARVAFVTFGALLIIAASDKRQPTMSNTNAFSSTEYYDVSDKPVLANGHIGYVPYSDSIYMNGLFNGYKGDSHRARIPNYANIYMECCGASKQPHLQCTYTLDAHRAVFETEANLYDNNILVKQIQYAHRFYDAVIVNTIQLKRNSVNAGGEWNVESNRVEFFLNCPIFASRIISVNVESKRRHLECRFEFHQQHCEITVES